MTDYEKLKQIQQQYPILTFQNEGYEYLDKSKFTEKDMEAFNEVTEILKRTVKEFIEFNNFKLHKEKIVLRMQTRWDESFRGVEYIDIEEFKNNTI